MTPRSKELLDPACDPTRPKHHANPPDGRGGGPAAINETLASAAVVCEREHHNEKEP